MSACHNKDIARLCHLGRCQAVTTKTVGLINVRLSQQRHNNVNFALKNTYLTKRHLMTTLINIQKDDFVSFTGLMTWLWQCNDSMMNTPSNKVLPDTCLSYLSSLTSERLFLQEHKYLLDLPQLESINKSLKVWVDVAIFFIQTMILWFSCLPIN